MNRLKRITRKSTRLWKKKSRYSKQITVQKRHSSQSKSLEISEKMKKLRCRQILPLRWLRNKTW